MQPLPEHNLELVVAGVLKKVFRFLLGLFCEFFKKNPSSSLYVGYFYRKKKEGWD